MVFDPLYFVFLLPTIVLVFWAQHKVKSTYAKYSKVPNQQRISGAEAARYILDSHGLANVQVEPVQGELSDHYDPRSRKLKLSGPNYNGRSVAALGIAAHETGHALQHAEGYGPLRVRGALVPIANIGSNFGFIVIIAGFFTGLIGLAWLGVALFALGTIFALITLPVEFNASARAMSELETMGFVDRTEYAQNKQVLNAAAWTYIAGFLSSLLMLLYWVMRVAGMSRD